MSGPGRRFSAGAAGAARAAGAAGAIGEEPAGATVVRHHTGVARACVGVLPYGPYRPAAFQEIVDGLTDAGVRVVLG
ncbi:hypothetical protein ACFXGT_04015 [Streptomyces sp. NPDC059352]|uniref:hypothetical protein n=1 Tax=Streptomyces sp. NPDC059352 TaxID=3346810 RepID=UPI0036BEB499